MQQTYDVGSAGGDEGQKHLGGTYGDLLALPIQVEDPVTQPSDEQFLETKKRNLSKTFPFQSFSKKKCKFFFSIFKSDIIKW